MGFVVMRDGSTPEVPDEVLEAIEGPWKRQHEALRVEIREYRHKMFEQARRRAPFPLATPFWFIVVMAVSLFATVVIQGYFALRGLL